MVAATGVILQVGAERIPLLSIDDGWKRAREVYESGTRSAAAVIELRLQLGHWLLGLYELTPRGEWMRSLARHGIHAKTASRAIRLARARNDGLLDGVLDRIADRGELVTLTELERELGIRCSPALAKVAKVAGVAKGDSQSNTTRTVEDHGSTTVWESRTNQDDPAAEIDFDPHLDPHFDPDFTEDPDGLTLDDEEAVDAVPLVEAVEEVRAYAQAAGLGVEPAVVVDLVGGAGAARGEPGRPAADERPLPQRVEERAAVRLVAQLTFATIYEETQAVRGEMEQLITALSSLRLSPDAELLVRGNFGQIRRLISETSAAITAPVAAGVC